MSIIVPRYGLPLMTSDGHMTREWYTFFSQIAAALGSPTSADDLMLFSATDAASAESLALKALVPRLNEAVLFGDDSPRATDMSLLNFWPLGDK